jgi:hypothetical protein
MRSFALALIAFGLPCSILGFAVDREVMQIVSYLGLEAANAESVSMNAEWLQSSFWFAPLMLWGGVAPLAVGALLVSFTLFFRD